MGFIPRVSDKGFSRKPLFEEAHYYSHIVRDRESFACLLRTAGRGLLHGWVLYSPTPSYKVLGEGKETQINRFQGPEEMGIVSLWPENMRLGLSRPLAWARASTEVPKRFAIALRVSPSCAV